jgi:hypothetical protein
MDFVLKVAMKRTPTMRNPAKTLVRLSTTFLLKMKEMKTITKSSLRRQRKPRQRKCLLRRELRRRRFDYPRETWNANNDGINRRMTSLVRMPWPKLWGTKVMWQKSPKRKRVVESLLPQPRRILAVRLLLKRKPRSARFVLVSAAGMLFEPHADCANNRGRQPPKPKPLTKGPKLHLGGRRRARR